MARSNQDDYRKLLGQYHAGKADYRREYPAWKEHEAELKIKRAGEVQAARRATADLLNDLPSPTHWQIREKGWIGWRSSTVRGWPYASEEWVSAMRWTRDVTVYTTDGRHLILSRGVSDDRGDYLVRHEFPPASSAHYRDAGVLSPSEIDSLRTYNGLKP